MQSEEVTADYLSHFKSYKNWFDNLRHRRGGRPVSKIMVSSYTSALKQFVIFLNTKGDKRWNPDNLIKFAGDMVATKMGRSVVDLMSNYCLWLQGEIAEGYPKRVIKGNQRYNSPKTAYDRAHSATRSFFVHNDIALPKAPKKDEVDSQVKANDYQYQVYTKNESDEYIKDFTDMKLFLEKLSFRDRVIGLSLISTGQDIGELLNLKIGFVTSQKSNNTRLYWSGTRQKTRKLFRTFFSQEATLKMRQYIEKFRKGASVDDPIFMTEERTYRGNIIEPHALNSRQITQNFNKTSRDLGFTNGGVSQHPWRPKRFRSIFRTACNRAEIPDDFRRLFMGHAKDMGGSYNEDLGDLESQYIQLEPWITVFTEESSAELSEVKAQAENALGIAKTIQAENKKLKDQLDKQTIRLEEFWIMIGTMREELSYLNSRYESDRPNPEDIQRRINQALEKGEK